MATRAPSPRYQAPGLLPPGVLWLPCAGLAGCVRGVMVRDTRGQALEARQRFNRFPATPLCSLSWWLAGTADRLRDPPGQAARGLPDSPREPAPSNWLLSGPLPVPLCSWNPGPVHTLTVMLMPDALAALTGLQPEALTDGFVDAMQVLPADWQHLHGAVRDAPDDAARLAALEAFLLPRWARVRPGGSGPIHRVGDWAEHLALRAALSGPGRSLRQWERRIKAWTGQPMRRLRNHARAEDTFFRSVDLYVQSQGQGPDWADLALQMGYADQAHLCRETRRHTGFTPAELRAGMLGDESFWPYRVWS